MKKNACTHILLIMCFLLASGCGAKTKQELMVTATQRSLSPSGHGYLETHRLIHDKIIECLGNSAQYIRGEVYPDRQEAEFYTQGIDAPGFTLLIAIKEQSKDTSSVEMYSRLSASSFTFFNGVIDHALLHIPSCPE